MDIKVTLDLANDPPVTCKPDPAEMGSGKATIRWVREKQQDFTFYSITGLPNPPFSNIIIGPTQITIDDDNKAEGGPYYYTVTVEWAGNRYSTHPKQLEHGRSRGASDPAIKNK